VAGTGSPTHITKVTEQSPASVIDNNFRKLHTEIQMLRRDIEPRLRRGEDSKDILDRLGGAPISKREALERLMEAQRRIDEANEELEKARQRIEQAERDLADARLEISDTRQELNDRANYLESVTDNLNDAAARIRRKVEQIEPSTQAGTYLYAPPVSFSRSSIAYVVEGAPF